eukprot:COSAG01_NODE_2381_length_7792_cov_5.907578_14_plen_125_part_01
MTHRFWPLLLLSSAWGLNSASEPLAVGLGLVSASGCWTRQHLSADCALIRMKRLAALPAQGAGHQVSGESIPSGETPTVWRRGSCAMAAPSSYELGPGLSAAGQQQPGRFFPNKNSFRKGVSYPT